MKLRQNNANGFISEQFKMCSLSAGTLQEKTITETPQKNGLAARCNRTMLEIVKCLIIDFSLLKCGEQRFSMQQGSGIGLGDEEKNNSQQS